MEETLYVWARPIDYASALDHTWVTTYEPVRGCPNPDAGAGAYWYCWGNCQNTGPGTTSRLLDRGPGDTKDAVCVNAPNLEDAHAGIPGFYGLFGVCHQVANRTLFAAGSPLTVKGAQGWCLSYVLYGPYGGPPGNWEETLERCGLEKSGVLDEDDLDGELLAAIGAPDTLAARADLTALKERLRSAKDELGEQVEDGKLSHVDFARRVNELLKGVRTRLAELGSEERVAEVCGKKPEGDIVLLDPDVARKDDM